MKIVFVILHYLAEEETYKSVESIKSKIDTDDYMIVIVDNASPDKSGKRLEEKYSEDEKINVILNKKNLGFAQGNNVGFTYAKEKWNPNFIVLMNNDVYLLDEGLVEQLEKEYYNSYFAVLGPLIMTKDGRCDVNPVRIQPMSKDEIIQDIKRYKRWLFLHKYHLYNVGSVFVDLLRGLHLKSNVIVKRKNFIERQENVQLHGCFMVFSQVYIERYSGLEERTFLYREEAILYKNMIENHLKTVYLPEIKVFHKEDAATDQIVKNKREEGIFVFSNHIRSLLVLLDVYEHYERL